MRNKLLCILAVLAMLSCIVFSTGVSLARYVNSATTSTVYAPSAETSTLAAVTRVYDFGCWNLGDEDCGDTITLISSSPLKGTLRFTWDSVTAGNKDIAVVASGFSGTAGSYVINEADGRLDFPFTLLFSGITRIGVATLDVAWIPDGKTQGTMSARYLLALNPSTASGSLNGESAQFVNEETHFLTGDLLWAVLNVPGTYAGAMIAPGVNMNHTFSAGIRYFTDAYPQGVTLLRDSVLYLPASDKRACALIDVGHYTDATDDVNFAAGMSKALYSVTSQTPNGEPDALTVSYGKGDPIISTEHKSLVFTLREHETLRDAKWNQESTADTALTWSVERLTGGQWTTVTADEHMTITAKQTATGGTITVSVPKSDAAAGTYRLITAQTYRGYYVNQTTTYFFVDYR